MEKVIAVGDLSGDDLFFPLIIGNGEGNLHRFIGRVLLGKVDEFYVESFLLLRLQWHIVSPRPSLGPPKILRRNQSGFNGQVRVDSENCGNREFQKYFR